MNDHGDVELETVELEDVADNAVTEVSRSTTYTWNFRNIDPEARDVLEPATDSPSSHGTRGP